MSDISADTSSAPSPTAPPLPPRPPHKPITRVHHGDEVVDEFDWLRDSSDPEVIAHLEAENAYSEARTGHLHGLEDNIFEEIKGHVRETDLSVPVRSGPWWYVTRTAEGQQYAVLSRLPATGDDPPQLEPGVLLAGEEVYLDCPALAAGEEFFRLGGAARSPDHRLLAYSVDTSGDERYDLTIKDLASGEILDEAVTGIGYGFDFSADGRFLFYARVDDAWRQFQIWRHEVGTDGAGDALVLQEDDERYGVFVGASRDERWLVIHTASTLTGEARLIPAADPLADPVLVAPRREGLDYMVEVAGDHLLITHNLRHAGFEISSAPLGSSEPEGWSTVLAPAAGERIEDVDAFAGAAAVSLRSGGLATVRVLPRSAGAAAPGTSAWDVAAAWELPVPGEITTSGLGANPEWETNRLRIGWTSLAIPGTVGEVDLASHEVTTLKVTEVPGYDPSRYRERRLWATAADGTRIPISLLARADVEPDGTAPGLLYGYGSYEASMDPAFGVSRLSLLDRGLVFAVAHVRGGGEMGRDWYDHGKLREKKNTFTDFVDSAAFLVESGWIAADRLAAEGRSAGGLLMGAVANLAPERFRVILAGVPFVDTLTTILDPSLPLTVGEWEEWGNPLADPEVYAYMKSYSPYENVRAARYPAILATTSLNDTRVGFVEPTKWIARLRETVTSDPLTRPILLRCEMVAGHGGRSGRYDAWTQRAEELAFVLDQLGAIETV